MAGVVQTGRAGAGQEHGGEGGGRPGDGTHPPPPGTHRLLPLQRLGRLHRLARQPALRHTPAMDRTHRLRTRARRQSLPASGVDRPGHHRRAHRPHPPLDSAGNGAAPKHPAPRPLPLDISLDAPSATPGGPPRTRRAAWNAARALTDPDDGRLIAPTASSGPATPAATNRSAASTPPKASNTTTPASSSAPNSPGRTTTGLPAGSTWTISPATTGTEEPPGPRPHSPSARSSWAF